MFSLWASQKEGAKWGDAVSPESLELLKGQAGVVLPKAELAPRRPEK